MLFLTALKQLGSWDKRRRLHCSFKNYVASVETRKFCFRAKDGKLANHCGKCEEKKNVSVTILVVVEKAKVKSDGKFPTSLLASDDLGRWLTEVQASMRPK